MGTSLVVQWLRLRAPNAGGPGSILGQGSNNRPHMLQLKIPRAATKTLHSQRNTYLKKRRSEYHHNPLLQADLGDVGLGCKLELIHDHDSGCPSTSILAFGSNALCSYPLLAAFEEQFSSSLS